MGMGAPLAKLVGPMTLLVKQNMMSCKIGYNDTPWHAHMSYTSPDLLWLVSFAICLSQCVYITGAISHKTTHMHCSSQVTWW